jgi:hypothetical protein
MSMLSESAVFAVDDPTLKDPKPLIKDLQL